MISKLLLCAAVLTMGEVETTEQKPQPQAAQPEEKAVRPSEVQTAQSQTTAKDDDVQTDATSPELEEKEIDGVKLQPIEANIISYTNKERARYGLAPLVVDPELMKTAREHAAWMTRYRSMVHTSRPLAENIAMGQPHSSDVVRAWMNSSGHRANILNAGHQHIGVAAFRTEGGTIFWCQQFRR
jgi:uncharacterized protein YkwD